MYAILAIAACCAIVPLGLAAVAFVNSLSRRRIDSSPDRPKDSREAALPAHQDGSDGR